MARAPIWRVAACLVAAIVLAAVGCHVTGGPGPGPEPGPDARFDPHFPPSDAGQRDAFSLADAPPDSLVVVHLDSFL